jgi:hypothetical protein
MITFLKELFRRKTRLEKLIEKADKYYKVSGKQYFVMPTQKVNSKNYDKSLILVHGKTFRDEYNEKARKLGTKQMSYAMMCNQCVYMTEPGTSKKR